MTAYCYRRDMATWEIWLPERYACLQDISFKEIPISSDLTSPAILPVCEIWLPARYCFRRDLPPGRYGYPRDIASDVIWPPGRYGYPRNIASDMIWPPGRYGYPRDIASDVIWPPARYTCLQDVSYKRIPISSDLTYPAICPQYISYNRMPISRDLTYLTILTANVIWLFICRRIIVVWGYEKEGEIL